MKEAEKALQIGHHIERWLEQGEHMKAPTSETGSERSVNIAIEPTALAMAYAAMGISQAHWARFTYDTDARANIQAKAVLYLRRSLAPKLQSSNNIEALFALALVLAEKREIPAAIKIVKLTLSNATKQATSANVDGAILEGPTAEFGRERKLIPVWHLLALLLTAREDFVAAEKACEAAFEQFGDPTILFGKEDDNSFRSEHLKEINGNNSAASGIIDQMETFEKSGVLQVKMTQLSLVEETDGSSMAVDGCDELLALYARLFGDTSAKEAVVPPPVETLTPPKSAMGGIRNSFFRGRGSVRSSQVSNQPELSTAANSRSSIAPAQSTAAPAIQVTDEDGASPSANSNNHHHHHLLLHRHKTTDSQASMQRSPSKLRKRSLSSLRRAPQVDTDPAPEVPQLPDSTPTSKHTRQQSASESLHKPAEDSDRSLPSIPHNMPPTSQPPPSGYTQQPLKQDTRLPASFSNANYIQSDPYFSRIQDRRQKITVLVTIWIFISGLYSRAKMFEDANDAVKEAFKLVETFESEVAQESSTSKAFAGKGWGGGKSVEELWADVYAAVSLNHNHNQLNGS